MSEPLPSNRKFGLLFTVVFAVLAGLSWWKGGTAYPWLLGVSGLFLLVTLAAPDILRPLNRAWMAFAFLLHRIMSPIILGALFFVLFTPVAFFMRLWKRDTMNRRREPALNSYWIPRLPPGPAPDSLRDQF
jgi:hypothetical protein